MIDPSSPPAARTWPSFLRSGIVVTVFFGAFVLLPLRGGRWWIGVGVGAVMLAAMGPMALRRAFRVLNAEKPLMEAFTSLVEMLAMLIAGFAAVYYAMNSSSAEVAGLDTRVDAVYFTVTTLSTVGFGDITAASQAARIIVTIQIVFDLLFLGVAVRVISTAATRRTQARLGGEQPFA